MPQGQLRAAFQNAMMNSLGAEPQVQGSPGDILRWCISFLHEHYPDHTFEYDRAHFGV